MRGFRCASRHAFPIRRSGSRRDFERSTPSSRCKQTCPHDAAPREPSIGSSAPPCGSGAAIDVTHARCRGATAVWQAVASAPRLRFSTQPSRRDRRHGLFQHLALADSCSDARLRWRRRRRNLGDRQSVAKVARAEALVVGRSAPVVLTQRPRRPTLAGGRSGAGLRRPSRLEKTAAPTRRRHEKAHDFMGFS